MLDVGKVYFDPNFQFSDGAVGEKLFVVLGKDNDFYTVAKTTSQQHERTVTPGCQGAESNFHSWFIPVTNGRLFLVDTWVCLDEFYTLRKVPTDANFRAGLFRLKSRIADPCDLLACALLSEDLRAPDERRLLAERQLLACPVPPWDAPNS
jgi:hypothetical protein